MILCLLTCLGDSVDDSDKSVDSDGGGLFNSGGDSAQILVMDSRVHSTPASYLKNGGIGGL
jgi:hypothetical protein